MEEQRKGRDDGKQRDQLHRLVEEAPGLRQRDDGNRAIVRRCRNGRRSMPVRVIRNVLAAVERGAMPELRTVADRGVDVDHTADADEGVTSDGDGAGMDVAGLGTVAQDHGFLAQDRILADGDEVGADGHGPAFDGGAAAKTRAEQAKIEAVERTAAEQHDGSRADQRLDHPEPIVAQPPDREAFRLPAPDQQPLHGHGEARHAEEHGGRQHGASQVKLNRIVQHVIDPVEARIENPEAEIAVKAVESELGRTAGPVGEVRGVVRQARLLGKGDVLLRAVQVACECRDRRVHVNVAHRGAGPFLARAQPGAEAGHQQGIGAEIIEEMILDIDVVHLQDIAQRLRHEALLVGGGQDRLALAAEPQARGLGKLARVHLVGHGHRQRRQLLQESGNHIIGKALAQCLGQIGAQDCIHARFQRVIADELHTAGFHFPGGDGGLGDAGLVEQHGLDLAELDAVAADLHLGVDAAMVLDLAIGIDAAEVAGAVDALRGIVRQAEKIGNEFLRRQVWPVEVTDGDADAGNADLAQFAGRRQLRRIGIEDDDGVGRQRRADGDGAVGRQVAHGGRDRRLRRAVGVQDLAAGLRPARDEIVRAGLAADEDGAQARHVAFDRGQERRRAGHAGNGVGAQEVRELLTHQRHAARCGHDGRTGSERHPDLLGGEIEGDSHALVDPVARAIAVGMGCHADEVADALVAHRHALGPARRA